MTDMKVAPAPPLTIKVDGKDHQVTRVDEDCCCQYHIYNPNANTYISICYCCGVKGNYCCWGWSICGMLSILALLAIYVYYMVVSQDDVGHGFTDLCQHGTFSNTTEQCVCDTRWTYDDHDMCTVQLKSKLHACLGSVGPIPGAIGYGMFYIEYNVYGIAQVVLATVQAILLITLCSPNQSEHSQVGAACVSIMLLIPWCILYIVGIGLLCGNVLTDGNGNYPV